MNNGGPAFPVPAMTPEQVECDMWPMEGMSLRDYFAAKALQGLLTHDANSGAFDYYAAESYRFADAMLKAREES